MSAQQSTSILVNGTKTFVPLENNPVVFSHLIRALGVSSELSFHDVYSIDEPSLLKAIPRPALALIFICPGKTYHAARDAELAALEAYDGSGEYPVMWFKQTIREACGLMGLLHAVCNGGARAYITPGSSLDEFRRAAVPLKTKERGELLYNSEALERAHAAAAQLGDTEAPALGVDANGHFICFVKGDDGHLWELCGTKGPIDRGELEEGDDALSERALRLGVRTFLEKAGDDPNFSLVALAPSEE
ncbi:Peptidase C12 ubiquitin carboxyl-terminal hydrolase 1 [Neofusicoccum parvum]|uniref:Ubiquitin carboxyl-terminal hydrolase n=1 Tax=Botryosphaeria parva (strain UCR-NP2) TaxID=1287680 RepID=R1H0U3_BOTPV|nr:putative ubiquitin c-terminal hydrolase l3 protein [Neofusicoccum parvum UCRNP2]GME37611.1 Peptidase C12 ubiquitin carboxyl-terminal hydrolase 1 [Neofusicoccum parvum]